MSKPQNFLAVFEGDVPAFEQQGRRNGHTTWSARYVAKSLGYATFTSFKTVLAKAQQVLLSLGIDVTEHFGQDVSTDARGKPTKDVRLSRFACYLVAMNGDTKKEPVARAQAYFARYSELCQRLLDDLEPIDRVLIRKELSKHEHTLSRTAKGAGVVSYALFQNAGYRGLYNMDLADLKKRKGIPDDRTPLDFMGKDELAANLFRITQTDAKIKTDKVRGQVQLENTAHAVGQKVRETMEQISGQKPEQLPVHEDIKIVRKELKGSGELLKYGSTEDRTELPEKSYPINPDDED